jgi:UDP-N-acetylglucosamine:LPS N-acetylglucosamine transferase
VRLANEISSLIDAPDEIDRMETASRKLARRDAAAATVNLIEELVKSRKQKAEGSRQ